MVDYGLYQLLSRYYIVHVGSILVYNPTLDEFILKVLFRSGGERIERRDMVLILFIERPPVTCDLMAQIL